MCVCFSHRSGGVKQPPCLAGIPKRRYEHTTKFVRISARCIFTQ